MNRPDQSDDGLARREGVRNIVVEFSNSPSDARWDESTPSQILETKPNDHAVQVQAVVDVARPKMPARIADRYDIIHELGEGGQASVYLAEDTTLGRKVAIKMPRAGYSLSRQQQEQFQQEARSIAALKHPGIVTVHDFGIHDDGRCYIVLEYLPGQSLKDCLKKPAAKKSFTIERSVQLISRIAEALHYAHQRGIYHRDLKPGNILLDEQGNPRISDFGLAVTQETQRDLKGEVAGTAPYMAPEQVRGESHWLNGQADIWALGVILYELLVVRRPFQGATKEAVYDEILHRDPTPPRQLDDKIPKGFEEVVMRCLEKDPVRRFATAGDVVAGLQSCLEGNVTPTASGVLRQPKRRIIYVLAAVVSVAALISLTALVRGFFFGAAGNTQSDSAEMDSRPAAAQTAPENGRPGEWRFLLDKPPSLILWPFPGETSRDWEYFADKKKVYLSSDKRHLLRLGKTERTDYDLSVTLKQTPWRGGRMGLFLGCHDQNADKPKTVQYETVTIEWNGPKSDKPFSVNHSLHLETPDGPPVMRHVPYNLDSKEVPLPGFKSLTIVVSVRERCVHTIVVLTDELNAQPLVEFRPAQQPFVPTLHGPPAIPLAHGEFGLFADESHDGISGDFLSFGLRFHD